MNTETYDQNGNTLTTGGKAFTYDSDNHLMTMTTTGTTASMIYDGDGNRVGKSVNGITTLYLVDDLSPTGYSQVVEELTGGAVQRQYTYGLQRISEYQIVDGAWTPSFYGYDGGSNVRALSNDVGAITDTYSYDAFGNQVSHAGTTPNNYLYRGEQYDPDLGLYYLRARYYNPATGRFMSRDPLGGRLEDPASLHKYLYANGDPANGLDPTGRGALVNFVVTIGRFLTKVPSIVEWGVEMTACVVALTAVLDDWVDGRPPEVIDAVAIGLPCGIFFFHSGALILSLVP